MSTWSKNSIWGHFDDGCKSKSHNRVIILTKIINLGVWEQLSILKIAFRGISQTGSRPHLIQHIKLCSCADFHAFNHNFRKIVVSEALATTLFGCMLSLTFDQY